VGLSGTSTDGQLPSLLTAQTTGAGNAGDLRIEAEQLNVQDGARVSVSSTGSGDAGDLEVATSSIRLDDQAALSADTTAGQGNIFLRSLDLVLRRGSNITTNATATATGGNITIDSDVIAALENSDITANALQGPGGRVVINTQGIFGTQLRNQQTPESDITASSDLGSEFSGTAEINDFDVDPNPEVEPPKG
jgi:large exoprotein involved in heme utilization and adhesion